MLDAVVSAPSTAALLSVLKRDLFRRYGADYSVRTEGAPSSALETLRALTHEAREVALLIAGREMTEISGVDYLARAGELHPQAKRLLLIPIGALFSSSDLLQAMALPLQPLTVANAAE